MDRPGTSEWDYMERPSIFQCFHMQVCHEDGCATLDTGCQRMAIGLNTLKLLQQHQPSQLPITFCKELHQFRSVHQVSCTTRLACIPSSLGPRGSILRPALFEEPSSADAPLLLSLPFLLHCKATLCLDEQRGLSLVSQQFGFKVPCHLGPTGALRIPIQQFTTDMISFLSQRIPKTSDEYELLQTQHVGGHLADHEYHSSFASSQFEKTPALGASPCGPPSHARSSCQAGSDGDRHPSHLAELDALCAEDHHDHEQGNLPQSPHEPQDARPSWGHEPTDSGDGRAVRQPAAGEGPGSPHRGVEQSRGIESAEHFQVTNPVRMVSSHRDREPQDSSKDNPDGIFNLCSNTCDPRESPGQHVGHSEGLGCEQVDSKVRLQPSMSSLGVQDGEESRSPILAMQPTQNSSMRIFHVADESTTAADGSGSSSSSFSTSSQHHGGVHAQEAARCLSASESLSRGHQQLHAEGDMQGLWQDTPSRAEALGQLHQEGDESPIQQSIPGLSDVRAGSACSSGSKQQQPPSLPRRIPGVSELATHEGGDGRQLIQPDVSETGQSLRAGLRRHIYGCLKRSENCWLEIFKLFCDTTEVEDEQQLQTTCQVMRTILQNQQPGMKHLSEMYLLQPKQLKTVAEICNPNRFGPFTDHFGLRAGQAFDLELGWNLLNTQHQNTVVSYLKTERPGLVVISPPCTKFSRLLNLSWPKWQSNPQKFDEHIRELRKARKLLKFCADLCLLCNSLGLSVVFEHPWSASSWEETCLQQLVNHQDFHLARLDQCMFGLTTDQGAFMRKRSGFLTNNLTIAQHLNSTCDRSHQHELVMGRDRGSPVNRSRLAQKYPLGLVNAILIAYAISIGLTHDLLYVIEGFKVLQSDAALENHLLIDGMVQDVAEIYQVSKNAKEGALELHPLDEAVEAVPRENFPGSHPLSLEALVKRAHDGLGHPGKERFLRILANSKASPKVMEIAKSLKCSVCEKFKLPRTARAAAPPKEIGLNEIVGVDTIQLRAPFSNKTKYCINIVDYSSHFQLIVPLTGHTAEATRVGSRLWLKIFGAPRKLLCDLGREFQKQFETLAEADGSELLPSSLESPEQRGFVERHGQLFKDVFYKTIEQTKCSTWDEWYQTIDLACSTKNRLLTRGGYSPAQRVFGYQQRIPGGLMSDGEGDLAVQSLAASGDVDVSRAMMIRKAASQAFHEVDCQQAIRAAATHGPPFLL